MGSQRSSQRKVIHSPPEDEVDELESSGSEQEWEARAILDERTIPNPDYRKSRANSHSSRSKSNVSQFISQYLIDWEGYDPETGERWEPSWEDQDGATQGLIDDWQRRKNEDPELIGRYTRNLEDKKRRLAAKERSQRRSSGKQSSTPKKQTSKRAPSGSALKAHTINAEDTPDAVVLVPGQQPPNTSSSTTKAITIEMPKGSTPPSQRKTDANLPTRKKRAPVLFSSQEGDESSERIFQKKATPEGSRKGDDRRKTKQQKADKSVASVVDPISRIQEKDKPASTMSPASKQSISGGKRKRSPTSKRRILTDSSEDDTGSATITARTTSARSGSKANEEDQPTAKRQKLGKDRHREDGKKADKHAKKSAAETARAGPSVSKSTVTESSKGDQAAATSRKTKDVEVYIDAPNLSSTGKPRKQQRPDEPPVGEPKDTGKKSVTFDHSQSTNSPSVVGDSQPQLTSSGESRESQRTPSQRTPSDLEHSTDVRRLAITGAMNHASLGSPKRPGQRVPSPLVNAEAGPSAIPEVPAPSEMEVDQEFVPNSLFATGDNESDHSSPDMPQSQAFALQRAIDLLMMEENFLEEEEKAKQHDPSAPPNDETPAIPANQSDVEQPGGQEPGLTSDAMPVDIASAKAKEQSKRISKKPFAAVDDFVAPAPSAKQALNGTDQPAATKPTNAPKELHPIPHIAPSVFRNVGISGTPESFVNTQADSIHDFESPYRTARVADVAAGPSTSAVVVITEQTVAVDAAVQTDIEVEQIVAQVTVPLVETDAAMEDEEETQLPELGEDEWTRILDTATINPSMLGKPPGVLDDEDMTSSDENSHRSDENVPSRLVHENDDLLVANAKIRALESDLVRVQLERKQLEEQVDALTANLQDATGNFQNTLSQYNLISELYSQASATAMRLNRENAELVEEDEKLKAQVEIGLKQKELFVQSFMEAKDREIAQLKTQNELLLQQAEKTDDEIRFKAARLPVVEAELQEAQAMMAVCGECNKRFTEITQTTDSDPEYRPTQKIVADDSEKRNTRSKSKAEEEPQPVKPVEKVFFVKPPRGPSLTPESEEARRKLPLTDLARWAPASHQKMFMHPEPEEEVYAGTDVAEVNVVHICRWRPNHGNVCGALFANIDDLARHTLGHFSRDPNFNI